MSDLEGVKLAPCLLCGCGMTVEQFVGWDGEDLPFKSVTHPKAACPLSGLQFEATVEAIAAWNRRSPSPVPAPLPGSGETVQDGWKLVPVEPTEEMVGAASKLDREFQQEAGASIGYATVYRAMLAASPSGLTSRLAAWFNALPDGGMGKEHFDALLAIVGAVPVPEPQAVAWRYRYEETGEDNEMIWSDWIVVKWKPNRSVFSTKVEIEPLAPLSGGGGKDNTTNSTGDTAEQRVTDEAIDRAIKAYCDEPSNDMRDMMRAALSTMGGKP